MELTAALREAISASGLSHAELARLTGIPQPTINRFVNGADMKLSTADRLAAHFGLALGPAKGKPSAKKPRR